MALREFPSFESFLHRSASNFDPQEFAFELGLNATFGDFGRVYSSALSWVQNLGIVCLAYAL